MVVGWALLCGAAGATAAGAGDSVVVVYNKNLPESKALAEFYAGRRGVPAKQLFGVDVKADSEAMSRVEFREKLQDPLFNWLVKEKLFTRNTKKRTAGVEYRNLTAAKIRYLVLCYGIPLRIARDTEVKEEGMDKIQEQLRGRNEAAVDADLALLPNSAEKFPTTGPLVSPFYLGTNATVFHPTNGILMVARLDGPTIEVARGLVDKAVRAESDGLWGHAYVDSRGLKDGDLKMGDDWMNGSAAILRRMGFNTQMDDKEATFDAGFPMSQIAFYVGWYGLNASGPFEQPTVEFMPGAFAYHLHSFSGHTLRSTNRYWVGPLLAKGATITMGCVDEPYLAGTPNVAAFLERLVGRRWTFGEAAYACQSALSWQTTVVGDPLYAPFAQPPDALHYKLEREKNPLVEWSHLRVVNLNLATGSSVTDVMTYLNGISATATNSAVLQEKLGDFALADKRVSAACEAYGKALQLKPSPQQKIRLLLTIGQQQSLLGRSEEAFNAYRQLVTDVPDYPDAAKIYRELTALARKLGKSKEAEDFTKEAERLSVPLK
jgi:uncharacterized protein (TIGR03790 family)